MTRCHYIDDVTPLPDASTGFEEPFLRLMKPCDKPAVQVRYENGIVVEGYCERHIELKGMSRHPSPNSGWEIYSDAKFYGISDSAQPAQERKEP